MSKSIENLALGFVFKHRYDQVVLDSTFLYDILYSMCIVTGQGA